MLGSERSQRQEIFGVWIEIVEGFFNCIAAEGHMSGLLDRFDSLRNSAEGSCVKFKNLNILIQPRVC